MVAIIASIYDVHAVHSILAHYCWSQSQKEQWVREHEKSIEEVVCFDKFPQLVVTMWPYRLASWKSIFSVNMPTVLSALYIVTAIDQSQQDWFLTFDVNRGGEAKLVCYTE